MYYWKNTVKLILAIIYGVYTNRDIVENAEYFIYTFI